MKFELFSELYNEALQYSDPDMYVAERGWQEWMDSYSQDDDASAVANILFTIYDLSKMDIKQLRASVGLTFKGFSTLYSIPSRTVQDWEYDKNRTPEYVLKFVSYTIFLDRISK